MAHFARIDENNKVIEVIPLQDEQEHRGAEFIAELGFDGVWIQTSYNGRIRRRFAFVGCTYDPINDVFIEPCPHSGWTLDENFDWVPPIPKPPESESVKFFWSDAQRRWTEIRRERIRDTKIVILGDE